MTFRALLEGTTLSITKASEARKFVRLFKKKLTMKDIDEVSKYLMSDALFDTLEDVYRDEEDYTLDIRETIKDFMKDKWFSPFDPKQWLKKWDDEAVKLVQDMLNK